MRLLAAALLVLLATPLAAQNLDRQPELIGGLEGLVERIQYPKLAELAGIEGTVFVQFVVDEQGDVRDAEVVRGIEGGGLNEEALRVVQDARFRPGLENDRPVKVKFTIPVRFVLPEPDVADQ